MYDCRSFFDCLKWRGSPACMPGEYKQAEKPHNAIMVVTFQHTHMGFLSFCSSLFFLSVILICGSDGDCGWMLGLMDGSNALSFFTNLRTQLPGETTMTPLPHTQPAHQGLPAGDTLHRAATTAANKVSCCGNGHECPKPSTHKNTINTYQSPSMEKR